MRPRNFLRGGCSPVVRHAFNSRRIAAAPRHHYRMIELAAKCPCTARLDRLAKLKILYARRDNVRDAIPGLALDAPSPRPNSRISVKRSPVATMRTKHSGRQQPVIEAFGAICAALLAGIDFPFRCQ